MKIQDTGYIKLHRRFLSSHVQRLNASAICLFIQLLLVADQTGQVITTLSEIQQYFGMRSKITILSALKQLESVCAISVERKPCLIIQIINWELYQAKSSGIKNIPNGTKNIPQAVQNLYRGGIKNVPHLPYIYKNSKNNFLYNTKNFLDFENPKTDLEKLVLFFLQGTKHPALKKQNKNEILNSALAMEIPHFQAILDNCRDLEQAKACIAYYVRQAKSRYNMYYLAQQIHSIRQEVESEEHKHG